jgi:uncharacterized lipoprotein YmbA
MKPLIALLAIVLTLGLGACSSPQAAPKKVTLGSCAPGDPGKPAILHDSYAEEGRVVRIAH